MFGLFSRKKNKKEIKDFYAEIGSSWDEKMGKVGVKDIALDTIVGSVGRSKELNSKFQFKRRGWTDRHQGIQNLMRQGKSLPPIKVFQVNDEHYIVDGHHRVAAALRIGYDTIRADITTVSLAA